MDLEEEGWVNIPYDGLLEVHDDGGKKFFSRKFVRSPKNLFKMDYFNSSQNSQKFVDSSPEERSRSSKHLIPLPDQLDNHHDHPIVHHHDHVDNHDEEVKEVTNLPILIKEEPKQADLDPIFQVFFKKENEFVEMKMDSPKSSSRGTLLPHIETDVFQYENKSGDHMFNSSSPTKVMTGEENKVIKEEEEVSDWSESDESLNIWKWGWSGIGAFCSFGMAAATICIIMFGNGQRHKQNQKIRIQIYSDDKRIKQVVHRANEAMSAVRGVPLTRAHITYGGYYEGL